MDDLGCEREKGDGACKAQDFGNFGDGFWGRLGLFWYRLTFLRCNCTCVQRGLYECHGGAVVLASG